VHTDSLAAEVLNFGSQFLFSILVYIHFHCSKGVDIMNKRIIKLSWASVIAAVLALTLVGLALAYSIQESVYFPNSGYTLDFLGVELVDPVNHQHTWTYAITAPDNIGAGQGLSHWTLEVNTCYEVIEPEQNVPYTTLTGINLCTDGTYNCTASSYTPLLGTDPTTGLTGIKFEDPQPAIGPGETHVFQITTQTIRNDISGAQGEAAMKYGNGIELGDITMPACSPSAVELLSVDASASPRQPYSLYLLVGASIALAGVLILRRKSHAEVGA
jgi:hypothetical protein